MVAPRPGPLRTLPTSGILFVEDAPLIRENLSELLREEGFRVHAFADAAAALAHCDTDGLPEAALLDISLGAEGQVQTAEALMRAARITVESNTVAAHLKHIRNAFRAIDPGFDAIRTERGVGYRWVGDQG